MSIEAAEYSQNSSNPSSATSRGPPPPPFSSSTLAGHNQRKRPVLSALGAEVTVTSDFASPTTPTPYDAALNSDISSLHAQPTPHPAFNYAQAPPPQQPSTKEPHLSSMHALLSEFQLHYDSKKQRIASLEQQLSALESRLQKREIELQSAANDRISAFKQLQEQRQQLEEMNLKLLEFSKYDSLFNTRMTEMDRIVSEMITAKSNFALKEAELNQSKSYQKNIIYTFRFKGQN